MVTKYGEASQIIIELEGDNGKPPAGLKRFFDADRIELLDQRIAEDIRCIIEVERHAEGVAVSYDAEKNDEAAAQ